MFNFKRREIRIEFNDPTPLCVGFLFLVLVYLFFSNPYHQTVLFVLCLGALAYLIVSKKTPYGSLRYLLPMVSDKMCRS